MKTITFYSKKDEAKLVDLIKSGENISSIARREHVNFNRTVGALDFKLRLLKSKMKDFNTEKGKPGRPKGSKNKPTVQTTTTIEKGVVVPQGVSLDLSSKRVVLYDNHVRIYF